MADDFEPMFGAPITGWWSIFAWFPTWTVDRGWVWMRVVYRRRIAKHPYLDRGPDFWHQYAVAPISPDSGKDGGHG